MRPDPVHHLAVACGRFVGLTVQEVLSIARTAPRRYKVYRIDKRSGNGTRTICHPSRELKALQYFFLKTVLSELPIHDRATAYEEGRSIKKNAAAHAGTRVILKMDFSSFFNSIKVDNFRMFAEDHFPQWTEYDFQFASHVLFWGGGSNNPWCLAIGAPTSPHLSNALMYEFDNVMEKFCIEKELNYTRYADDLTFSSNAFLDQQFVVAEVRKQLARAKYTRIEVNEEKTNLVSKSHARRVTGIVLTNDGGVSIGRERKRLIRAMLHTVSVQKMEPEKMKELQGLLSFASDIEPDFLVRMRVKYGDALIEHVTKWHGIIE